MVFEFWELFQEKKKVSRCMYCRQMQRLIPSLSEPIHVFRFFFFVTLKLKTHLTKKAVIPRSIESRCEKQQQLLRNR